MKKYIEKLVSDNRMSYAYNIPSSDVSGYKGGGQIKYAVIPKTLNDLKSIYDVINKEKLPYHILGAGTKTLVLDDGYSGLTIATSGFKGIWIDNDVVSVGCGERLPYLSRFTANRNLSGLEELSGIPASMGGAVFMNSGAFNKEIAEIINEVTVFDLSDGKTYSISSKRIPWGYRTTNEYFANKIIVLCTLRLKKSNREIIEESIKKYADWRKANQPTLPSLGSTFKKTNDGVSAGYLIDRAMLKGISIGGATISPSHANFIVNSGNGTAKDYLSLSELMQSAVHQKYNVKLEREFLVLGDI